MPSWVDSTTPTWPQSIVSHVAAETTPTLDVTTPATCGTQYQVDVYNTSATTDSLVAGGVLTAPNSPAEDLIPGGWGVAYKLVQNAACPPVYVPPTPQSCTAGSEHYADYQSEDVAPVEIVGGLEFNGTHGTPVDTYHGEHVALGGINGLAYTIASNTSGGADPAYVLEVDTLGTSGYTTLSAEPYMNGHAIDASGTFDVDGWAFWSSHIASGDGSQAQPEPLSWFEQTYPNAEIISHGIHLGTSETTTDAVVTSTSFLCGVTTFGLPAVVVTPPTNPTPPVTPTTPVTPAPTPTPAATPTVPVALSAAPVATSLPHTGSNVSGVVIEWGFGLLLVGVMAFLYQFAMRRRRS